MPSRNTLKQYESNAYYHIYNRGVEKRNIFLDEQDYAVFLSYIKRHLDKTTVHNLKNGHTYPNYQEDLNLLAFCLMPNHFHMLVLQYDDIFAITRFLRSLCTAYTMYFNKKYKRVGHLFQGRFKASRVSSDAYVQHISRYIHLNPEDYLRYPWSSLPYYLNLSQADWINPKPIIEMFESPQEYLMFVKDYEAQKELLDELKFELAN